MTPMDAYVFAKLIADQNANGELAHVSAPFRGAAEHLAALPPGGRQGAWTAILACQPDPNAIISALANVDPNATPPTVAAPVGRCATLADVRSLIANTQWTWEGWLAAGVLTALAATPGIGKTTTAVDLARRLWFGLDWPDGQKNTIPSRTKTLWVPGDRHYAQLLELAKNFNLPDEALLLNAPDSDAIGGLDLDDPDELAALKGRIQDEKPGLVFIDTVGMTTGRNLCRVEDARAYYGPLMDLALDVAIPIMPITHLNKDGQALGLRINEKCRLVWKLTHPDPDGQPDRRRLWVEKTYALKPPPLGMTITTAGCDFDFNPPTEPVGAGPGRPPVKADKAIEFVVGKLSQGDEKQCDLINEWVSLGESKDPIFRAFKVLEGAGRLVIDASRKPKICHLVSNSP